VRHACAHQYFEKGLSIAGQRAWVVFKRVEQDQPAPFVHPKWSDKPLLKSYEKTKPPLGLAARDDFALSDLTGEARQAILDGKKDVGVLLKRRRSARSRRHSERDGKTPDGEGLPDSRHFEDVMAIDTDFFKHLEASSRAATSCAQRREAAQPRQQHDQAWRGSVLTVDLTNALQHDVRPCFMDGESGRVRPRAVVGRHQDRARQRDQHQAAAADVGPVLRRRADDLAVLPRRGALRAHRRLQQRPGRDQGIESPSVRVREAAAEAGLRYAYLQFDGIATRPTSHRRVGNLFDVKLRAIENLYGAGSTSCRS